MSSSGRDMTFLRRCLRRTVPACAMLVAASAMAGLSDQSAHRLPQIADVSRQLAAADVNGDLTVDLVVANRGQPRILVNDGAGVFADATDSALPVLSPNSLAAVLADVDGDGDPDLVLANQGQNQLLLNDGAGLFTDATASNLPVDASTSVDVAAGDLEGDGDTDLVVANRFAPTQVLMNTGAGVFMDDTAARLTAGAGPGSSVALADLDGNGSLDLLVVNDGAPNRVYINNGLGVFTAAGAGRVPTAADASLGSVIADVDVDGDRDILLADGLGGVTLWLNDGNAAFSDDTTSRISAAVGFTIDIGVADLDEDGDPDLVLANAGQDRVLLNDGTGHFTDAGAFLPADDSRSFGVGVVDVDRDLDADVLLATPGLPNRLLVNDQTLPRIRLSTAPAYVEAGEPVTIGVEVYDEDGIASTELTVNGSPVPLSGGVGTYLPPSAGVYTMAVTAEDNSGAVASRGGAFEAFAPDTSPPVVSITTGAPSPLLQGQVLPIHVEASDDRIVAGVSLAVDGSPVPLDHAGNGRYVTGSAGVLTLVATALDGAGNDASATLDVEVLADDAPPSIAISATPDPVDLLVPVQLSLTAQDNVAVSYLRVTIAGPGLAPGTVVEVDDTGQGSFIPRQPGAYTVTAVGGDPAGNTASASTGFTAQGTPDDEAPEVVLSLVPHSVAIGGTVELNVAATDNVGVTATRLEVNGTPVALDAGGNASYTPPLIAVYEVRAYAEDAWGNVAVAADTLQAVDPADDANPPRLEITSPADGAEIDGLITLEGTVRDETLASYRLEYSPRGLDAFTEFADGTREVVDGPIATLDTALLEEGYYEIRLSAEDHNGNTAAVSRTYVYVDHVQLGRFTLEYEDVRIPAMGVPISVGRAYDSNDAEGGDFGPGWRLALLDTDLRKDAAGNVFVTLPNGRRTGFAFTPRSVPFFPIYEVVYTAPAGVHDTLETPDCDFVVLSGGQWFCDLGGGLFNPVNFRLTTREGMTYDITQGEGITRIEDRNGNFVAVAADGITASNGRSVVFERDAQNRIVRIEDPAGGEFSYQYDGAGRLSRTIDQNGNVTDFTYLGTSHRIDDILTPAGCFPVKNVYDADGRLAQRMDSAGNITTYGYDEVNRTETVTNGRGYATTYHYDPRGRTVRIDDPLGTSTRHTLDEDGNRIETVDPSGRVTRFTYDANGNQLTRTVEPRPGELLTHTTTYNGFGQVTSYRRPEGGRVEYTYDANGNRLTREFYDAGDGLVAAESYTYDVNGNRLTWTDAEGKTTTYTYDAFGNRLSETDATGVGKTYEYDANGNQVAATDSLGNRNEFSYDGLNQPTGMTHGGEATPRFAISYNEFGKMDTLTDGKGQTTRFHYDCLGNLTVVTDPGGRSTTYGYDPSTNLAEVSDANGRATNYTHDPGERQTARTGPDGSTWGFGYSADGILDELTTPNQAAINHVLDDIGRVVQRVEPERVLGLDYDGNSSITRVTEEAGGTAHASDYRYDSRGLLLESTDRYGRSLVYTRNGRGDVTSLTTPDGAGTVYSYDDAGRIRRVTTGAHWAEYSYDGAGRVERLDYSNGTYAEYGHDTLGNLTSVVIRDAADAVIASYSYTLDRNGQRTAVTTDAGSASYSVDALGRLTGATVASSRLGSYSRGFSYDDVGNRLDAGATFGVDNRLLTRGGQSYGYDDNGNLTGRGSETFGYSALNRLTTYSDGVTAAAYEHDFLGRRVHREVDGAVTRYLYDEQNVIAEYDASGAMTARYTYAPGLDRLLMVERAGQTWFYHTDGQGSVVAISDAAGAVVQRYGYDAWGNIVYQDGPFTFSGGGAQVNTRTYIGREYDAESGLYHMRARAYDPAIGRFLQKDPEQGALRLPQSQHLYAYALNNPLAFKDPTGRTVLVQYAYILTGPNMQELAAAIAGFLHGYGSTGLVFIGEFLNLHSSLPGFEIDFLWDQAVSATAARMEEIKNALGWAEQGADLGGAAAIPGAFKGGVSWEIGVEITLFTGDGVNAKFSAEGGGFERGVEAGLAYIRSLRPM